MELVPLDIFSVFLVAGLGIAALPWTDRELGDSVGALATVGGWVRRLWGSRTRVVAHRA